MISYEFEGFDLTEWKKSGGLPVWAGDPSRSANLIAVHADGWVVQNRFNELQIVYEEPMVRYSALEDVIGDRPEWSTHLSVNSKGVGSWIQILGDRVNIMGITKEIKGHLFDPSVYAEPVKLEEVEK
jgi:hypothetical protein